MALYTIKNLSFTYPGQKKRALRDLDFTIEEGEFLLVCGRSGCGKTTLLRHLKTAMAPHGRQEGEILFHDKPLAEADERTQAAGIGYVLQDPQHQLVTDKVWHELAFGLESLGTSQERIRLRTAEMANYFGIESWFYRSVEELSGGQKQLLNLASVMAMQPEVLVLDEPTAQLDPIAAGEFLSTLKKLNEELGTTIILIEQRLEEVFHLADRVLALEEGRLLTIAEPYAAAESLAKTEIFPALPAAARIAAGASGFVGGREKNGLPLTVREGRNWLVKNITNPSVTAAQTISGRQQQSGEPILTAKELWFRYDRKEPDILKGASFTVEKGEIFCLLGGNGAGKSTALSLVNGINRAYRGRLLLHGKEISRYTKKELFTGCIATLPQDPQTLFVKDTVGADLRGMLNSDDEEQLLEQVIADTQLEQLLDRHPYDLSGGEQQRAALAKILLLQPELLLLDEPTKGMDAFYKQKLADILRRLKQQGKTILMVSHDVEFCASCGDTCALLFQGEVVTTQPAGRFFAGNSFYTTAANRISRRVFENAVTAEEVITLCRENQE